MPRGYCIFNSDVFSLELLSWYLMNKSTKDEIINDFVGVIDQIGNKPSDELESSLQKIVYKIRPHIHNRVYRHWSPRLCFILIDILHWNQPNYNTEYNLVKTENLNTFSIESTCLIVSLENWEWNNENQITLSVDQTGRRES